MSQKHKSFFFFFFGVDSFDEAFADITNHI